MILTYTIHKLNPFLGPEGRGSSYSCHSSRRLPFELPAASRSNFPRRVEEEAEIYPRPMHEYDVLIAILVVCLLLIVGAFALGVRIGKVVTADPGRLKMVV